MKIISLKPQLPMIAANITARNPGMISALLITKGVEIEIRGLASIEYIIFSRCALSEVKQSTKITSTLKVGKWRQKK